jgi:hypothetical protein
VDARAAAGGDPSEATVEVLERQLADAEPLAPDELPSVVRFDAERAVDAHALAAAIAARVAGGA